jgi:hypothetical protein
VAIRRKAIAVLGLNAPEVTPATWNVGDERLAPHTPQPLGGPGWNLGRPESCERVTTRKHLHWQGSARRAACTLRCATRCLGQGQKSHVRIDGCRKLLGRSQQTGNPTTDVANTRKHAENGRTGGACFEQNREQNMLRSLTDTARHGESNGGIHLSLTTPHTGGCQRAHFFMRCMRAQYRETYEKRGRVLPGGAAMYVEGPRGDLLGEKHCPKEPCVLRKAQRLLRF